MKPFGFEAWLDRLQSPPNALEGDQLDCIIWLFIAGSPTDFNLEECSHLVPIFTPLLTTTDRNRSDSLGCLLDLNEYLFPR